VNGNVGGGWTGWIDVPDWFSWENQGGSVAPVVTAGRHELAVLMVDNPPGQNAGLYRLLPLDEDPAAQGSWEELSYHSGVLAIHAAVLPAAPPLSISPRPARRMRRRLR